MEILPAGLDGVKILRPRIFTDLRGRFVKTFHAPTFQAAGLDFTPQEEFFSVSQRNVIRGMHFQRPPDTQARLVACLTGGILDVILDLRKNSPTFGRVWSHELNPSNGELLFIPAGFAHGFLALADNTLVTYAASAVHAPVNDTGVRWDSIGFDWPVKNPIMSDRDQKFPAWHEFNSPF